MDFDQAELEILNSLHIKKIYDLRSKEEVKDAPDPTLKGAEYIHSSAAARADGTEVNFFASCTYRRKCLFQRMQ